MAFEIIAGRSKSEKEKLGTNGTILLGKQYVQMERTLSLANPIYLDVASPHVILVSGKRGSGKSYSLGVIAEGLLDLPDEVKQNISGLIFDTMGIFWTAKYPNYRDDELLKQWGLSPRAYTPKIFVPAGMFAKMQELGIPADFPFAISVKDVSAEEWAAIFRIDLLSDEGILIERAIEKLKEIKKLFDIDDLIEIIRADKTAEEKEKNVLDNRFSVAKKWGLFAREGTSISDLFEAGAVSVLDLSAYALLEGGDRIKALVIGFVSKKILEQRMAARKAEEVKLISEGGFLFGEQAAVAEKVPLVWIFIDEAHEFIPNKGSTLATQPLVQLLREGRQPGISLVLATQQPGKIHTDVMTQADVVLSHRVTSKIDVEGLNLISSTYLPFAIQRYIDELPSDKGSAILLDDKQEKIYPMRVRPRMSWHGGEDPTAIKSELRELGLMV